MRIIKTTCDVKGCGEDANYKGNACMGWVIGDKNKEYKKMERPLHSHRVDLCEKHWIEWCKATIKVMKMDKGEK